MQAGNVGIRALGTHNGTFNTTTGSTISFAGTSNGNVNQFNSGSAIAGTGNVNFDNGNFLFEPGSSYAATLPTLLRGAYVHWNMSDITLNNFTFQSGRNLGVANITLPGQFTWTGGEWRNTGNTIFTNTAAVSFNGGDLWTYTGSRFTNNTTISFINGRLISGDGGTFSNNGVINIAAQGHIQTGCTGCPGLTFTNSSSGVINKNANDYTEWGNSENITFNNNGIVNLQTGNIALRGNGTHAGTFNIATPGTLSFAGNSGNYLNQFNSGSSLTGTGAVNFDGAVVRFETGSSYAPTLPALHQGAFVYWNAANTTINNYTFNSGKILGTGILNIDQQFTWSGGMMTETGSTIITLTGTGTFNGAVKELSNGRQLVNNGLINWSSGNFEACGGGDIINNGELRISNSPHFATQCTGAQGITLLNNGTINRLTTGSTIFNTYNTYTNNGILKGIGEYIFDNGTVTQNGAIAPGSPIGALTYSNRQPFGANTTLAIELNSNAGAGTGHDILYRNGNTLLNGTLTVTETGTVPSGNYSILSLTSGTISGDFTTVNLPSGYSYTINPTSVVLTKTIICNNPTPVITASGPLTFCAGGSVTLTSDATTGNLWSNGATTQSITVNSAESYTVSYTDGNGCTSSVSSPAIVTVIPKPSAPSISAIGTSPICANGIITLISSVATGNNWTLQNSSSTLANTQNYIVSAANTPVNTTSTFVVTTTSNGCTSEASAPFSVTIFPLPPTPTITTDGPTTFCSGGTVTLTSDATSGNLWSNGATTQSITVSDPGNYQVTVTDINNCNSTSATTTVTVLNTPLTPSISANGSLDICHNSSVTLTSSIGAAYLWSNGETTRSIEVTTSGIFSVVVFNNEGCPSLPSAEVATTLIPEVFINSVTDITVNHGTALDPFNFTGNATSALWINNNTSIGLAASGFNFIPGFTALNTGSVPSVGNIVVTPYIGQCAGTPVGYTITVNPPSYSNSIPNQIVCTQSLTDAVDFNDLPGVTYSWTNDNTSFGLDASGTGDIAVILTQNSSGIAQIANITVTPAVNGVDQPSFIFSIKVLPMPVVTPLSNILYCDGTATDPVIFTGNGTSYAWTNSNPSIGLASSGTGDIPSFVATASFLSSGATANIMVRPSITDGTTQCLGSSEQFNFIVNPTPVMNNVADRILCHQSSTIINFSGFATTSYEWTNDNFNVPGLPPSGIGNIGSYTAYNLTNQDLVGNIVVRPKFTGNGFFCYGESKNFQIVAKAFPDFDPIATLQQYCKNQQTNEVVFNPTVPGTLFTWTNTNPAIGLSASGTGNVPSFTAINDGTNNVTSTIVITPSFNGCTGNPRNFDIIVRPSGIISPIANQEICNNYQTNMVTPQTNYGSAGFLWTNDNPAIGVPATYTGILLPFFATVNTGTTPITANITVSEPNQTCPVAPVSFTITVHPSPVLSVINSSTFCSGTTTPSIEFVSSQPGSTFTWSSSNTTFFPLPATGTGNIPSFLATNSSVSSDLTTLIYATVQTTIGGNACFGNIRSFNLNIKKTPAIFSNLSNKIVCHGETFLQTFNGNTINFRWTNNNTSIGLPASGNGEINFIASNTSAAPISALITVYPVSDDGYGCEGAPVTFNITVNPQVTINTVNNIAVCNGTYISPIEFSGNAPNTIYTWNNNGSNIGTPLAGIGSIPGFQATNNFSVGDLQASFRVVATTNEGRICSANALFFNILVYSTPVVTITASGATSFCAGGSVVLTSSMPTGNIWSTGETTRSITVNTTGNYYVQNNINPACSTAVSNSIDVTVTASLVSSVTISASETTVCRFTPITFTANVTNVNAPTYRWFVNNVQVSTAATFTSGSLLNTQTVRCSIQGTNPCTNNFVSLNSNNISITVLPNTNAGSIAGPSILTLTSAANYTSNGNTGGIWSTDNTSVLTVNSITGNVVATGIGSANLKYTIPNGCNAPAVSNRLVTVISNTNLITGPDAICITGAGVFAAGYNYVPGTPTNGTWSSGNSGIAQVYNNPQSNGAQVAGISAGTTTINYTLSNGGGTISKTITVNQSQPLPPIEGPRNLCRYAQFIYFADNPADYPTFTYTRPAASPATGYNWTVPSFLQIISGQGTTTLTVKLISDQTTSAINRIYATPLNYCPGTTDPYFVDLIIWGSLSTPSPIVASTNNICANITNGTPVRYTINKVTDAAVYDWSFPQGITNIVHPEGIGANDTTVLVQFTSAFQSGTISVIANNGCTSEPRSLFVTRTTPATPGLITGPSNSCQFQLPNGNVATYSVQAVSGISYTWTVPSGVTSFSGQGTNSISFRYPNGFTSGTISVTATNGCGTSIARTLNVGTLYPTTPGVIDVIQEQSCPNRIFSYAIASLPSNSSGVLWEVPAGGTIIGGQGTRKIFVVYANSSINGKVNITALGNCRNSATRTVSVKLPACAGGFTGKNNPAENTVSNNLTKVVSDDTKFSTSIFPNPTSGAFQLKVLTAGKETVQVLIRNAVGKIYSQLNIQPNQTIRIGEDLPPGIYLLVIKQNNETRIEKLVKL